MTDFAIGGHAMNRWMTQRRVRKGLLLLLASIGSGTVLYSAAAAGLRLFRNQPPDSAREMVSPDGRYRIVVTEDIAGFPGSVCIKQVYVIGARARFDRNDEDNLVFSGACAGLGGVQWDGARVRGIVIPAAAVVGVDSLKLKQFGANGEVQLDWTGHSFPKPADATTFSMSPYRAGLGAASMTMPLRR